MEQQHVQEALVDRQCRARTRWQEAREDMAIRYFVAVQAVEHGIATEQPRKTLHALARGPGQWAIAAQNVLDDWELGYPPSL